VSGILLFLGAKRFFLLNKNLSNALDRLKPHKALKIFENFYKASLRRKKLYKEFKGDKKGYIYMIVNKLNGKCYVGSTRSVKVRLYNYFNIRVSSRAKRKTYLYLPNKALFSTLTVLLSSTRILNPQGDEEIPQDLLNPMFVTGFTDAEGYFLIIIRKSPKYAVGWRVEVRFGISLHKKDLAVLQLIKNYFNGVGNINKERETSVQYHVTTLQDLTNIIIPAERGAF